MDVLSRYMPGATEDIHGKSVTVAGVSADIRTDISRIKVYSVKTTQ
jgi:hypothetical protein